MGSVTLTLTLIYLFMFDSFLQRAGGLMISSSWRFATAATHIETTHLWKGMIVVAFGTLVISMVDKILQPLLLGEDAQMHPLMIFLSILGGIMLFNFSGFVLGPVITSLLFAVCKMYIDHYQHDIA